MSDSQDELLTRPAKHVSAAEAEKRGRTVAKNAKIPILDQIVKPSKQKDLADLLIKIIQTNEAEDTSALSNFDADVSSATLRDIDAKLNEALDKSGGNDSDNTAETSNSNIPMLTEIAEFPVSESSILKFPTAAAKADTVTPTLVKPEPADNDSRADGDTPIFEFPATSQVGNETAAANSGNAPQSANQDNIPKAMFSLADESPNWQLSEQMPADLSSALASSGRDEIEELVEQHAAQVRAQLDRQIEEMKRKLLADLLSAPTPDA